MFALEKVFEPKIETVSKICNWDLVNLVLIFARAPSSSPHLEFLHKARIGICFDLHYFQRVRELLQGLRGSKQGRQYACLLKPSLKELQALCAELCGFDNGNEKLIVA